MEYKNYRTNMELLHDNVYRGYRYCIMNYGTHPCIYVVVPEGHPYFGARTTGDMDIEVHGGVTYCSECPWLDDAYAIGWDYVHPGDYYNPTNSDNMDFGHKWTIEELDAEAHLAIDQLVAIDRTIHGQRHELRKAWRDFLLKMFPFLPHLTPVMLAHIVLLSCALGAMILCITSEQWWLAVGNGLLVVNSLINLYVERKYHKR